MKNKFEEKYKFYLEDLEKETVVYAYLDLANMFHWQEVLGWSFRLEDAIRQVISIKSVKEVKVYYGTNSRQQEKSDALQKRIRKVGAILRTKPVKFIKKNIDAALLLKRSTMTMLSQDMNTKIVNLIEEIKQTGILLEEPKCNFDVEMTMDLMDDTEKMSAVMLFSGDSDLAGPLERLKLKNKNIYVVGVRGMTAKELHEAKDTYIDFGKFYSGNKRYPQDSENPAVKRDRVNRRRESTKSLYRGKSKKSSMKKVPLG